MAGSGCRAGVAGTCSSGGGERAGWRPGVSFAQFANRVKPFVCETVRLRLPSVPNMEKRLLRGLARLARGDEWQPISEIQVTISTGAPALLEQAERDGLVEVRRRRIGKAGPERREIRITRAGVAVIAGRPDIAGLEPDPPGVRPDVPTPSERTVAP